MVKIRVSKKRVPSLSQETRVPHAAWHAKGKEKSM